VNKPGLRFLCGKGGGFEILQYLAERPDGSSFTSLGMFLVGLGMKKRYNDVQYPLNNLLKNKFIRKTHISVEQYTGYNLYKITKEGKETLQLLESLFNDKVLWN